MHVLVRRLIDFVKCPVQCSVQMQNGSNKFMFDLLFSQLMLHVYLIIHVVTFLLKMLKTVLSEVFRGGDLETIKSARSGSVFEGEIRKLKIKIEKLRDSK